MLRGVITESITGSHVVIQLPNGESRRFEMSEVRYAGPASGMPQPKPEPEVGEGDEPKKPKAPQSDVGKVSLRLESKTHDVTFWAQRVDGDRYRDQNSPSGFFLLCLAPCTTKVTPGSYRFAVAVGRGKYAPVDDIVRISKPLRLRGEVDSKGGTRAFGWVFLGISSALALGLAIQSQNTTSNESAYLFSAVVFQVLGLGLGLPAGLVRDEYTIEVDRSPLKPAMLKQPDLRSLAGVNYAFHF